MATVTASVTQYGHGDNVGDALRRQRRRRTTAIATVTHYDDGDGVDEAPRRRRRRRTTGMATATATVTATHYGDELR